MEKNQSLPNIVDSRSIQWESHPRFPGILMKKLITTGENQLACVNLVQVPPGCEIGWHHHSAQIETIYLLQGQSILTINGNEMPFNAGQIVAIPPGVEHTLCNRGKAPVELLTIFTPPL
jgi:quercetin dioxygenase-like cupin family protein